jgi:nicotinamide-nucleotide amidase
MEALMCGEVVPFLQKHGAFAGKIFHRTLMVYGVPEARLSDELEGFETALPQGVSLAYLPNHGIIRLRLTGFDSAEEVEEQFIKLSKIVKPYLVAIEDLPYEQVIGNLLKRKKANIAVSESCTSGYLSHLLTKHAGSSAFFKGGLVAYQNEVKSEILQVRKDLLKKHGAVSELVVRDMALNTLQMFDADYAIAISGIAGPDGGTPDKPVGTVWIAAASSKRLATKLLQTSGTRQVIIVRAAYAALNLLQREILVEEEF